MPFDKQGRWMPTASGRSAYQPPPKVDPEQERKRKTAALAMAALQGAKNLVMSPILSSPKEGYYDATVGGEKYRFRDNRPANQKFGLPPDERPAARNFVTTPKAPDARLGVNWPEAPKQAAAPTKTAQNDPFLKMVSQLPSEVVAFERKKPEQPNYRDMYSGMAAFVDQQYQHQKSIGVAKNDHPIPDPLEGKSYRELFETSERRVQQAVHSGDAETIRRAVMDHQNAVKTVNDLYNKVPTIGPGLKEPAWKTALDAVKGFGSQAEKFGANTVQSFADTIPGVSAVSKAITGHDTNEMAKEYLAYTDEVKQNPSWGKAMSPEDYFRMEGKMVGASEASDILRRAGIDQGNVGAAGHLTGAVLGTAASLMGGGAGAVAKGATQVTKQALKSSPNWLKNALSSVVGSAAAGATYQTQMELTQELTHPAEQTMAGHLGDIGSTAAYYGAYGVASPWAEKAMGWAGARLPQGVQNAFSAASQKAPRASHVAASTTEGLLSGAIVGAGMFGGELAMTGDPEKAWNALTGEAKGEMAENFIQSIAYALLRRGGVPVNVKFGISDEHDPVESIINRVVNKLSDPEKDEYNEAMKDAEHAGVDRNTAHNIIIDTLSQTDNGKRIISEAVQEESDSHVENQVTQGTVPTQQQADPQQPSSADDLYQKAVDFVRAGNPISTTALQAELKIGAVEIKNMIDRMEAEGIVTPDDPKTGRQLVGQATTQAAMEAVAEPETVTVPPVITQQGDQQITGEQQAPAADPKVGQELEQMSKFFGDKSRDNWNPTHTYNGRPVEVLDMPTKGQIAYRYKEKQEDLPKNKVGGFFKKDNADEMAKLSTVGEQTSSPVPNGQPEAIAHGDYLSPDEIQTILDENPSEQTDIQTTFDDGIIVTRTGSSIKGKVNVHFSHKSLRGVRTVVSPDMTSGNYHVEYVDKGIVTTIRKDIPDIETAMTLAKSLLQKDFSSQNNDIIQEPTQAEPKPTATGEHTDLPEGTSPKLRVHKVAPPDYDVWLDDDPKTVVMLEWENTNEGDRYQAVFRPDPKANPVVSSKGLTLGTAIQWANNILTQHKAVADNVTDNVTSAKSPKVESNAEESASQADKKPTGDNIIDTYDKALKNIRQLISGDVTLSNLIENNPNQDREIIFDVWKRRTTGHILDVATILGGFDQEAQMQLTQEFADGNLLQDLFDEFLRQHRPKAPKTPETPKAEQPQTEESTSADAVNVLQRQFYAVAPNPDEIEAIKRRKPENVLISYGTWGDSERTKMSIRDLVETLGYKPTIIADNGAFSNFNKHRDAQLYEVMEFFHNQMELSPAETWREIQAFMYRDDTSDLPKSHTTELKKLQEEDHGDATEYLENVYQRVKDGEKVSVNQEAKAIYGYDGEADTEQVAIVRQYIKAAKIDAKNSTLPDFFHFIEWLGFNNPVIDYVMAPDILTKGQPFGETVQPREESILGAGSAKELVDGDYIQQLANFTYQVLKAGGYKSIPVFQYFSDTKYMDELIAMGADYIAIATDSSLSFKGNEGKEQRASYVRNIIQQYSDSGVKFHLLGTNDEVLVDMIGPGLYSVDGTTWQTRGMRGVTGQEERAEAGAREIDKREQQVEDRKTNATLSRAQQIANDLKTMLQEGKEIKSGDLFRIADKVYRGTQSEGTYTPKDAYDALELAVNQFLLEQTDIDLTVKDPQTAKANVEKLAALTKLLPTQSKRTEDQERFQQFSTPPAIAYVAAWVANIDSNDTVLEPSAGIGGLALFGKANGASVVVNELDPRRLEILRNMPFDQYFSEDGEQIHNIMPKSVQPTVAIMNPPFSTAATRGVKDTKNSFAHVDQALKRLEPGGRLVAILGLGREGNSKAFHEWLKRLSEQGFTVRAAVGVDGKNYAKYGTTFDVQYVVVDKVAGEHAPIMTKADSLEQVIDLLEGVANERQKAAPRNRASEQNADQPAGTANTGANPEGRSGASGGRRHGSSGATSTMGDSGRERTDAVDQPGADVQPTGEVGGTANATETDGRIDDGNGRNDNGEQGNVTGQTETSSVEPSGSVDQQEGRPGDNLDDGRPGEGVKELTDSVFEEYTPKKLKLKNAQKHPGMLAESAAMSAIDPPDLHYKLHLPEEIITSGKLSDAQLEVVAYAGQAHSKMLADGQKRRGFFVGDGTGFGKGREISGIILDNFQQGRTKAVWVSMNDGLLNDSREYWAALGGNREEVFKKPKPDEPIKQNRGILYITYNTLARGFSTNPVPGRAARQSRVDQLVEWFGADYDGVIVFDEAHNMANAMDTKGVRGVKKASDMALAGIDLQNRLPNARIVYASATGATEVSNLAYADRLGLWGVGTAFASRADFINKINAGGIAAMELVARDMKAMGLYIARNLSYVGVEYEKLTHDLTPDQTETYDLLARSWQIVLQNIHMAIEATKAPKSSGASQFWGAQQRFFNQVLTAMQMPRVLEEAKKDLAAGKAVVMQLVNTNEASQDREIARIEEQEGTLEDLDLTPRDIILQFIDKSFPTQQHEEYIDDKGNKRSRPVVDSQGNPVINAEAQEMKNEMRRRLSSVKVPQGPLEMVLNTFGVDNVAEITGRSQRVVQRQDENTGRMEPKLESRTFHSKEADVDAFMSGKKNILVFSNAGGTGRSYHADRTKKNQNQRMHYLIQAGWEATKAVQGFGRTHRTNQASSPVYKLFTTNLKGQMRFVSSIARRLDQLGALTKGQRQTGSQGLFSAADNLESNIARRALVQFYHILARDGFPHLNKREVLGKMGLETKILDEFGRFNPNADELTEVTKFLNRILTLESGLQNLVFDAFQSIIQQMTQIALQDGTLDTGLENIKAETTKVKSETEIRRDEDTNSVTSYYQFELGHKTVKLKLKSIMKDEGEAFVGVYQNERSKAVRAVSKSGSRTLEDGRIVNRYLLQGPEQSEYKYIDEVELERSKWVEVPSQNERQQEIDAETYKIYRRDVKDAGFEGRPQGLYTSIVHDEKTFESPHTDVGDTDFRGGVTPKNPLIADNIKVSHARFGEFGSGYASSGVAALKKLVPESEFERLMKMNKKALLAEINERFPGPDYSGYHDAYDLLEAYVGQLAREKGHDAIIQIDKEHPSFSELVLLDDNLPKWEGRQPTAESVWAAAVKEVPPLRYETVHLISGTLLPIWDRLPTDRVRVVRVLTDDGKVVLGRMIPENHIDNTLHRLGAEARAKAIDLDTLAEQILDGHTVVLANGWKLSRRRVSGEHRIELTGDDLYKHYREFSDIGVFSEIIGFETRYFVPIGDRATPTIKELVKHRPVAEVIPPRSGSGGGGGGQGGGGNDSVMGLAAPSGSATPNKRSPVRRAAIGAVARLLQHSKLVLTPVAADKIAEKIVEHIGTIMDTGGMSKRGRLGEYDYKHNIGRVRKERYGEWRVIGHEIGHAFDNLMGLVGDDVELRAMYHALYPKTSKSAPVKLQLQEGFAEFFQQWVVDPELARKNAPKTTALFEDNILSNKKLQPLFAEIRAIVDADLKDNALGRFVGGGMVTDVKEDNVPMGAYAVGSLRRAIFEAVDFTIPARDMAKAAAATGLKNADFLVKLLSISGDAEARGLAAFEAPPRDTAGRFIDGSSLKDHYQALVDNIGEAIGWEEVKLSTVDHEVKVLNKTIYRQFKTMGAMQIADALLIAQRVNERRKIGFNVLPMTDDMAKEIMDIAKARFPDAIPLATELARAFSYTVLEKSERAGLIDAATRQRVEAGSDFYIPFIYNEKKQTKLSGKKLHTYSQVVKRFSGKFLPVVSPLQAMITKLTQVEQAIEFKRVISEIQRLAKHEGMGPFASEIELSKVATTLDMGNMMQRILHIIGITETTQAGQSEFGEKIITLSEVLQGQTMTIFHQDTYKTTSGEPVILNFVNGKPQAIKVAPDIFKMVQAMRPVQINGYMRALAYASKGFRWTALATPTYIKNAISRDMFTAVIQAKNPIGAMAKHSAVSVGVMMGAYINHRGGEKFQEWTEYQEAQYKLFQSSGGASSAAENMLRGMVGKLYSTDMIHTKAPGWAYAVGRNGKKVLVRTLATPSDILRFIEEGPRLAAFMSTLKQEFKKLKFDPEDMYKRLVTLGTDALPLQLQQEMERILVEATYESAEIETNFRLHGANETLRKYTPTVTFLHGTMQGTWRLMRQAKENKAKTLGYAVIMVGGLSALSMALMMSDDDDRKWFQNIPSNMRDKYWWFPNPYMKGTYFTIAKPFDYALFANFAERFADWQWGDEASSRNLGSNKISLLSTVFDTDVFSNVLKTGMQLWANQNDFGADIVPMNEVQNLYPYMRYDDNKTSLTARFIGETIAKLAGDEKGFSPRKVDYFVQNMLGRWGDTGMAVSDWLVFKNGLGTLATTGEAKPLFDGHKAGPEYNLVYGALLYGRAEGGSPRIVEKFYDDYNKTKMLMGTVSDLLGKEDTAAAAKYATEENIVKISAFAQMDSIRKFISDSSNEIDAVMEDPLTSTAAIRHQLTLKKSYIRQLAAGILYGQTPPTPQDITGITQADIEALIGDIIWEAERAQIREAKKDDGPSTIAEALAELKGTK